MYTVINLALNASQGPNYGAFNTDSEQLMHWPTLAAAVQGVLISLPDQAEGCVSYNLCPNAWLAQAQAAFGHLVGAQCGGTHTVHVPNGTSYVFVPMPYLGANTPMVS